MKKLLLPILLSGILLVPVIAFASPADQERAFRATFAGIYMNKDDFSYTGAQEDTAVFAIVTGKSTLGKFTAYAVAGGPLTGTECVGMGGAKGLERANTGEDFVLTFEDTGEQLFLKHGPTHPGRACRVPGIATTGSYNFDVVGGTGRFENATGSITKTFKGLPLAAPASPGKGVLLSFTGTFDGTIKLAGENTWPF